MVTFGTEQLDFSQSAIEVFKNGKLAKKITLRDIADTAKLPNNGKYFSWGYRFNKQAYGDARSNCESCNKVYERHILTNCDTSEIYPEDCLECRAACDSAARGAGELMLAANSVFVRRDTLYVLTCLGYALSLPFRSLGVEKVSFDKAVSNLTKFSPRKVSRKYSHVTYPEQFGLPLLANRKRLDEALAASLAMSVLEKSADSTVRMTVHCLMMINRSGKCAMAECEVNIYDGDSVRRTASKEEKELEAIVAKWLLEQSYDPSLLPKGAKRFFFRDYFFLK